jgi:hypothetical protein
MAMHDVDPREAILQKALIQDTVDRYAMFLNCRDWDTFALLLRPEFVFTCSEPIPRHCEGREVMVEMLRGSDNYRHGYVFQMPHGVVIDRLEGAHARARHTLHIKASGMNVLGIYYDALVRNDDSRWRFARRDYHITYHDGLTAPGALYRTFPDPGRPDWYFA